MVKPGSNLCGLTPQVFWTTPFFFSEIRTFYKIYLNILQGSCRVIACTEQALQNQIINFNSIKRYCVQIYQKVNFIGKNSFAIYLYRGTLGTFVAHLGAVLWQLLCRVTFGRIWALGNSWTKESCKICQKYPCLVTVIAQRPDGLQRFQRCQSKDKWQSYLFF